jgi:hypothetical protein
LNLRPPGPQPGALPDCATPRGRAILRRNVSGEARSPSEATANICSVVRKAPEDSVLRRCGRCGELKSVDEFNWRRKHRGQRDSYCRPCRAVYKHEHYAANRQRYIDNAVDRTRTLAFERAAYLIDYFRTHPCADCGESDPVVLEFDHQSDKLFCISQGLRDRSWQSVLDEIAKCEVVCANCHRRRTARRRNHTRAAIAHRSIPPPTQ